MEENLIKEYVLKGGQLFIITSIQSIRDGGTRNIKTSKTNLEYFVHKDSFSFHTNYPAREENKINDPLLINYLIERIESYIKGLENDVIYNKNLLQEVYINNQI